MFQDFKAKSDFLQGLTGGNVNSKVSIEGLEAGRAQFTNPAYGRNNRKRSARQRGRTVKAQNGANG
jgi:hypothetical protein